MQKKVLCFAVVAALILMVSPLARAGVIFDNGGPDLGVGAATSTLGPGLFVGADDFQLAPGATTLTDVHWWGGYGSNLVSSVDNFTIRLFADNGGTPEETPSVLNMNVGNLNRVFTATAPNGLLAYAYSVDIAPVQLQSNTVYYISIVNDFSVVGGTGWAWFASDTDTALEWARIDDTGPWAQPGAIGRAFNLTGAVVPEPSTLILLGTGAISLFGYGWRRKRKMAV